MGSEAAALTAFYVLIVTVIIRREITLKELPVVMRDSMKLVGAILLILAVSIASTNYMIDAGVPEMIFGYIQQHISNPKKNPLPQTECLTIPSQSIQKLARKTEQGTK